MNSDLSTLKLNIGYLSNLYGGLDGIIIVCGSKCHREYFENANDFEGVKVVKDEATQPEIYYIIPREQYESFKPRIDLAE